MQIIHISENLFFGSFQKFKSGNFLNNITHVPVSSQGLFQQTERRLIKTDCPIEWMILHFLQKIFSPKNNPCLGPTKKLVSAETHYINFSSDFLLHGGDMLKFWLLKSIKSPTAPIIQCWNLNFFLPFYQIIQRNFFSETLDEVV